MKKLVTLISLVIVTFFMGCSGNTSKSSVTIKEVYKEGVKIELKSIAGSKITLLRKNGGFVIEDDEAKIVLIDIFGTFCAPCQEEAPLLMDFQLQNSDDVFLLGLNFLEEVSDEYVVENFASRYNAYYFISNAPQNKKIVETILEDIQYKPVLQVPLKVVLKDGQYQNITDIYTAKADNKVYLGRVGLDIIQKDIDAIKSK